MLKSCVGWRLGVGAADGAGVDLLENGLERIVVGGLLGLNDGRDGVIEGARLGVNDGLEGAALGALLGLNDGLEGAALGALLGLNDGRDDDGDMEGALPELNGELEPRDGPGLELGLMASRLAAIPLMAALRSEPPRAAITLGVA